MKYLGILLTKCVQNPHTENNKTLMREIKEDPNTWKIYIMFKDQNTQHCYDVNIAL